MVKGVRKPVELALRLDRNGVSEEQIEGMCAKFMEFVIAFDNCEAVITLSGASDNAQPGSSRPPRRKVPSALSGDDIISITSSSSSNYSPPSSFVRKETCGAPTTKTGLPCRNSLKCSLREHLKWRASQEPE